ncbi:hypothetical protein ACIGHB_29615 [Streptomyces sp. NPDC085460]|uniref:hypothetical protein n=1 Tax=Streptomyces sp. NPDC085460 TaxID=3365723 RepID=UPI0037D7D887
MPDEFPYEWRPAPCPVCQDPAARLVAADRDRSALLLCGRCPAYGKSPYRHLSEVHAILPLNAVLAMGGEVLRIGVPAAPPSLNPYTQAVVKLATERGFIPVWHRSPRRHRVILTAPVPDGAWGWLEVGACSGKILRAGAYPKGRRTPGVGAEGPRAARRVMDRLSCGRWAAEAAAGSTTPDPH